MSPVETAYWSDWPACPQCGRRRQTECPICGIAGNDFPLADFLAPAESFRDSGNPHRGNRQMDVVNQQTLGSPPMEVLLHCPQCDEVFHPQFYRHCPECALDQGGGIQIPTWEPGMLPFRVMITIIALLGAALAATLYLWLLYAN